MTRVCLDFGIATASMGIESEGQHFRGTVRCQAFSSNNYIEYCSIKLSVLRLECLPIRNVPTKLHTERDTTSCLLEATYLEFYIKVICRGHESVLVSNEAQNVRLVK